ncbi:MAG TPA: DUF5723 family protein [Mucilaginibacter sp.]
MKQFLLVFGLLLVSAKIFGQQFSQYNTGTLYDSFENPSQKTFTPDSSRQFASNFLVPNFNLNAYLTGNAQAAAKTRLFSNYYNTSLIQVGQGRNNLFNVNANAYILMFKMFTNLNGKQEWGFSINTKAEGRGLISDESVALFNGLGKFSNNSYNNIFNDNFYYQVYHQIGFTYREQITKQFAFGIKINALSGVSYQELQIVQSHVDIDRANDAATLSLRGINYVSGNEGRPFAAQNFSPTFRNPGASISIGSTYKTKDGFTLQANIKDLGFIHWNKNSNVYLFNNLGDPNDVVTITGLSTPRAEDNIYHEVNALTKSRPITGSFNTPTNGLAELSVNKSYWLNDNGSLKFAPTLIASKELAYSGFTGALVAPVQYQNYTVSLTPSYNDLKLFNLGAQFMVKTPNCEFFIGSESLVKTGFMAAAAIQGNQPYHVQYIPGPSSFIAASFFMGFSMKFGPVIEHPMNANYIPMGEEKGFLGRLWDRLFPKDPIRNN